MILGIVSSILELARNEVDVEHTYIFRFDLEIEYKPWTVAPCFRVSVQTKMAQCCTKFIKLFQKVESAGFTWIGWVRFLELDRSQVWIRRQFNSVGLPY